MKNIDLIGKLKDYQLANIIITVLKEIENNYTNTKGDKNEYIARELIKFFNAETNKRMFRITNYHLDVDGDKFRITPYVRFDSTTYIDYRDCNEEIIHIFKSEEEKESLIKMIEALKGGKK